MLPRIQSQTREGKTFHRVADLNASLDGQDVLIRARAHTVRATGKRRWGPGRQGRGTTMWALPSDVQTDP